MSGPRVAMEDVHKSFRIFHASNLKGTALRVARRQSVADSLEVLRGVTFSAEGGERVGLIGRNGAGKSTVFRLLSHILKPDRGRIDVRGRVAPLIELTAGLHPDLSGRDNLLINGAVLGLTRREVAARYDQIVEFAGLEEFMATPCRYYSSGMAARLGFSIAVHVDADVVLIDEALAVGDAAFQRRCLERMREIADSGAVVIFVSHEEEAVRSFCNRLVWLDEGRVRADGEVDATFAAYNDAALAD